MTFRLTCKRAELTSPTSHRPIVVSRLDKQLTLDYSTTTLFTMAEKSGFRPPIKSDGQGHVPRNPAPLNTRPLQVHRVRPYPRCVPPESSPVIAFRPIHPSHNGVKRAYYWVDTFSYGGVPSTALWGGEDIDGHQIYVGRAYFKNDWIPAKVIPGKNVAYVAYGGKEYDVDRFQVLCEQRFDWVPAREDDIPEGAVEGGRTADGEPLYVGRVKHDGSHTVGKVHPSHKCCFIPFAGKELSFTEYEILILRP